MNISTPTLDDIYITPSCDDQNRQTELFYLYLISSVQVVCHFNIILTGAGVMHEAGYVYLTGAPSVTSHLDINILSILHHLGSPLEYCTLIYDLVGNLYIYNACTYILIFIGLINSPLQLVIIRNGDDGNSIKAYQAAIM